MRHEVACPHCSSVIIPQPFVGRVIYMCPWCEDYFCIATDSVTFESSQLTVARLMNGEATEHARLRQEFREARASWPTASAGPRVG
jgi:hypothetical protein